MSRLDFHFEFHNETPQLTEGIRTKAEERLQALADNHTDMIGASVAVREVSHDETLHSYEARVVAYIRPENIAAVEKGDALQPTLERAINAVERQILQRREKFRKPWEQSDKSGNKDLYKMTPRELYDAYADQTEPDQLLTFDRDYLAARLMVDKQLDRETAYYTADQILIFAQEISEE